MSASPPMPRLTYLRIKNYRALRDVEFRDLTPLTVLIGPNGSGKSTVLDALDFLAEAVRGNLTQAWEKRDRFRGMRTQGSEGNIEFNVEAIIGTRVLEYRLSIQEYEMVLKIQPLIADEKFEEKDNGNNISFQISGKGEELGYTQGYKGAPFVNSYSIGSHVEGLSYMAPQHSFLQSLSSLNAQHPMETQELASAFHTLLKSYRLFHLTDDHLKGYSDAGPREKLSPNGDNLPNVLYYLHERHPETLAKVTAQLRRWVPQLADVVPEITSDERLLLRFRDGPFEKLLPAQYMSGGTMRLAALLTLLYEPNATGLLGIEEPENELHPQLLPRLAEELIAASEQRQLLIATHSPFLLDALEPAQVWILHRGPDGYTQATRAADIPGVPELVEDGSPLGYLWSSNSLRVGNPLSSPTDAR